MRNGMIAAGAVLALTAAAAAPALVSTGLVSTGLVSTGLVSTGLVSTGLVSTGLASTGLASTGLASTGLASTGQAGVPGHPLTAAVSGLAPGSVTLIDTRTNTRGATVPVGKLPTQIVLTPAGTTAYVLNAWSNSVSMISTG